MVREDRSWGPVRYVHDFDLGARVDGPSLFFFGLDCGFGIVAYFSIKQVTVICVTFAFVEVYVRISISIWLRSFVCLLFILSMCATKCLLLILNLRTIMK